MSVYILSVLTDKEFNLDIVDEIRKKIQLFYPNNKITFEQYNYDDRKYKELDFNINNIIFHKEIILSEIDKLIETIVVILNNINISCEVIGG